MHDFTATPLKDGRYEITRSRHPDSYIFTLINEPISAEAYQIALRDDYLPEGNFNKELIIRILKGEQTWIYDGRADTPAIRHFTVDGMCHIEPFTADIPQQLHHIFGIEPEIIQNSFELLDTKM